MQEFKDEELVSKYLKGDEAALEVLIKRYLRPIYGFVYSRVGTAVDAQDITQDVFVKVWKNIKKFDPEKKFKTWIFTIAKNTAIDFLKKKSSLPFSAFENAAGQNVLVETLADDSSELSVLFERNRLVDLISKSARKLSQKYREVLDFRYNYDLSFREIAEKLDEPIDSVKSRHRRALIILKKLTSQS